MELNKVIQGDCLEVMKEINDRKLINELIEAGISINGCNSNGIVYDLEDNEIQDRADVAKIIKKHNSTPISVETFEEKIAKEVKKQLGKK